jgi:hypothetical protein
LQRQKIHYHNVTQGRNVTKGLYLGKYLPPWGGEGISVDVIWGEKICKSEKKKGENVKENGNKMRKGK